MTKAFTNSNLDIHFSDVDDRRVGMGRGGRCKSLQHATRKLPERMGRHGPELWWPRKTDNWRGHKCEVDPMGRELTRGKRRQNRREQYAIRYGNVKQGKYPDVC
ncbi:hypothetical protein ILUMI_20599 [Ignelater luminosus]|uniref:Uncharacterized protein n=1 Tax=Ignelater luminosus TaxID=2038154 RepID=A0A8K0CH59_IGNLU|nr:hypothetical protein ILUMI_20599 [Ignelater luminosus]